MSLTEKNIENRKKGVGASEAAIVLGLNPMISPYELWLIKTGRKEATDISDLPQVYWGTILEEPIAQEYAKRNNCKVRRATETKFHPEHKHMLCHIDRKIEGEPKLLECKFAMFARDDWGDSGSDVVPLAYIVQVQYQLAITGYKEGDLAVNIGGWDYREYHFTPDPELIKKIIDEVNAFWKCVETDTPPPLRDTNDAMLAFPFSNGKYREADDLVIDAINKYCQVREQAKVVEEEQSKLKDVLTLWLKDDEGITKKDKLLATWKTNARGSRVLLVKVKEAVL